MLWSRLLLAASIAFMSRPAVAQRPDSGEGRIRHHHEFLVSTEWLARHLDSSGVVVVHVGRRDSAFLAGHVPGARFLSLAAVATTVAGVPNEFPPETDLEATFRSLGVGDSARIVIYGDDAGLLAARAWVALDLLGQSGRAALLDGGFTQWVAERRPVETGPRAVAARPFTARWRADPVVSAAWVRARLGDGSVFLVDARSPDLYAGRGAAGAGARAAGGTGAARAENGAGAGGGGGHLPGARSLYWMDALESSERPVLKSMHALHETIWKAAGADRPAVRTVVTYCQTGMQASFDYFVARYVGYPDVRLYDGSVAEWMQLGYPVERSSP